MLTLIDCDGVLADWTSMAVREAKTHFGIELPTDDGNNNWDLFQYPEVQPIKDDLWKHLLGTKGLFRNLDPFPYAKDLLEQLRSFGDVVCVTSVAQSDYYACERMDWLIEEMDFHRTDIILGYKKYLVEGDVFIDDKPSNIVQWADRWYNEEGIPVLWQPPNRSFYLDDDRILHTGSVDELMDHLIEEGKINP